MIAYSTWIPLVGFSPKPFFIGKGQDTTIVNIMKEMYDMTRDKRGFAITSIKDTIFWLEPKVPSRKLLRKMRPNQSMTCTITAAEQWIVGDQMNYETYLLNELLFDATNVQDKVNPLNYSWLLILISFFAWEELPEYQGVDVLVPCRGAKYQNLWFNKENPQRQKDKNIGFYLQAEEIRHFVKKKWWITKENIELFQNIKIFWVGAHHIFLHPRQDP